MIDKKLEDEDVMWSVAYATAMALSVLGQSIGDADSYADVDEMSEFCEEVADKMTDTVMKRLRVERKH